MPQKNENGSNIWVDPEDAPELTADHFERADVDEGETLIRRGRGRPVSADPKQLVSLRLDADVIEKIRATGSGWQTRINEALRQAKVR